MKIILLASVLFCGLLFAISCGSIKSAAKEAGAAAYEGAKMAVEESAREKAANIIKNDPNLSESEKSDLLARIAEGGLGAVAGGLLAWLRMRLHKKALGVVGSSIELLPPEIRAIVKSKVSELGGDPLKRTIKAAIGKA